MGVLKELTFAFGKLAASTFAEGKAILVNIRGFEGPNGTDEEAEIATNEPFLGQLGVYARPEEPVKKDDATGMDPEGETEVLGLRVDDRIYPIATRDLRLSAKVNPQEGEVGLVQYRGGFISLKTNDDGNGTDLMVYMPRNDPDGVPEAAACVSINTTDSVDGGIVLTFPQAGSSPLVGASISITNEGKIVIMNAAADANIEVNDDGIGLNGVTNIIGGLMCGNPLLGPSWPVALQGPSRIAWEAQVTAILNLIVSVLYPPTGPVGTPILTMATTPVTIPVVPMGPDALSLVAKMSPTP